MKNKLMIFLFMLTLLSFSVVGEKLSGGSSIIITKSKVQPYPVEPGNYFQVYLKVTNYGNQDTKNFKFNLDPEFPFQTDSPQITEYGVLSSGEEILLNYKVRVMENAVQGINKLKYKYTVDGYTYKGGDLDILIQTQDAEVEIIDIITNPENMRPGEEAEVTFVIKNNADSYIKNVELSLDLEDTPFTPVDGSNSKRITTISSGEEKSLKYKLISDFDSASKAHKIPITLSFSDNTGEEYVKNKYVGLRLYDKPEYMVNLEETDILKEGQKGEIVLSLSNIGTSEIKFLRVKVKESEDYKILSNSEVYVGNVESDDFETMEFEAISLTDKEVMPLQIELNYRDTYNNKFKEDTMVPVRLFTDSELKEYQLITGGSSGGILLLLAVVAGAGGWYYFKKKKKNKKK